MSETIQIPASQVRKDFAHYLRLVDETDVEITRNGKVVAMLTSPHRERLAIVAELAGCVDAVVDEKTDRAERLARK